MRSKLKIFTVFFGILFVCWMAQPTEATILFKKDFGSLVQEADGIIVGTVEEVFCDYDDNDEIFTFVTLVDLDVISGNYDGDEFTVRIKGGRIDVEVLEVEGSPQFDIGEQVVLFVKGNGKLAVPIVGWTQGVLRVVSSNSRKTIMDYEGNHILGTNGEKLRKDVRNASETTFVDEKTGAVVSEDLHVYQSEGREAVVSKVITKKGKAGSGRPDDDYTPEKKTSPPIARKKKSLTLDELKDTIIRKAKTYRKANVLLESADVTDLKATDNQDSSLNGRQRDPATINQEEVEPFLPKLDKKRIDRKGSQSDRQLK